MSFALSMGLDILITQNFTKPGEPEAVRCDTENNLLKKGCPEKKIINPPSDLINVRNKPLTSTKDKTKNAVQLQPQEIALNLRPGMSPKNGRAI